MPKRLSRSSNPSPSPFNSSTFSPSSSALPASLADPARPLPKLIVFDLDYTLWPFWVDTHVSPPLRANAAHSSATDKFGESFAFYADIPAVLAALPRAGVRMAAASRTSAPSLARDLLKLLHIPPVPPAPPSSTPAQEAPAPSSASGKAEKAERPKRALDVFDAGVEAYPSSKVKHFESIQKRTGVSYEDMLFFDDEARNRDTESLGVTMWLVRDGVSWGEVERGVEEWRKRRGF